MSVDRAALISLAGLLVLAACAVPTPSQADLIATAVKGTIEAEASLPPMTATPTPSQLPVRSQTPTSTSTLTPTASLTPTPPPQMASVSLATNCRTGPGSAYPFVFSLEPGQVARVTARSTVEGYWYIANPNQSDEHCWLWGEYATVEGDASILPVLTPEPSPIPRIGFTMYRHSFSECGSMRVVFTIVNNSVTTFRSARIHVEDLSTSRDLRGPKKELHPFSDNPSSCPRDKDNFFPPGAVAYILIPISPFEEGNDAIANIKLCTEDDGGGDCVTKLAYFRLPDN